MADLDPGLISAVQGFEGFRPRAYPDGSQWSIGYGTRATSPNEVINHEDAVGRLQDELWKASQQVDSLGVPMTPGQRNALTSLTYNTGSHWMNSGLGNAVRAGNWDEAQRHLLAYNKAGGVPNRGLANRRATEASWMSDDGSTPVAPQTATRPDLPPTLPRQQMADPNNQQQQPDPMMAMMRGMGQPNRPGNLAANFFDTSGGISPMERAAMWLASISNPSVLSNLGLANKNAEMRNQMIWRMMEQQHWDQMMNRPHYGVTGYNWMGLPQYGWTRPDGTPVNQTNGAPIPAGAGGGGAVSPGTGATIGPGGQVQMPDNPIAAIHQARAQNPNISQEDLLKMVPEEIRDQVRGIANYDTLPSMLPNGRNGLIKENILSAAQAINPAYDQSQAEANYKFGQSINDDKAGTSGSNFTSMTRYLNHQYDILGQHDRLGNSESVLGGYPGDAQATHAANAVKNSKQQYKDIATTVDEENKSSSDEYAKAIQGGDRTALGDREDYQSRGGRNMAPSEVHGLNVGRLNYVQGALDARVEQARKLYGENNPKFLDYQKRYETPIRQLIERNRAFNDAHFGPDSPAVKGGAAASPVGAPQQRPPLSSFYTQ